MKNGKTSPPDKIPPGFMKMKDLVDLSGAPKSTIIHYVNEGLLPEPIRTGPNMAYYAPSCVERISFIKQAQAKHRLPLTAIKGILRARDKGLEVTPLIELHEYLFGGKDSQRLNKRAFCRATGLSEKQVDQYVESRLLIPMENGFFDQDDVIIGGIFKRGLELGLTTADWSFYPESAENIVNNELRVRNRLITGLDYERNVALTLELTKAGRALRAYVIDRVFQQRIVEQKTLKNRNQDDSQPDTPI